MQSVWNGFQACMYRLAHVMLYTESEIMSTCASMESKSQFSIKKRAAKYSANISKNLPKQFDSITLLQQARAVANNIRDAKHEERFQSWKAKPQHGAYLRNLCENNLDPVKSLAWVNSCFLDPSTESYLFAAQELALFTRYHERYILKSRSDDLCRICGKESETIYHILSGCDSLAKREYFVRHNAVCKYVHYMVMKNFGFQCAPNWFVHTPVEVVRSKSVGIVYDQLITTDRPIGANRPDLLVRDKLNKKAYIIDISCPCDTNVWKKENEKVSKYGPLRVELQKMWGCDCVVIPVIIGGLGAVSKNVEKHLLNIPGAPDVKMCHRRLL